MLHVLFGSNQISKESEFYIEAATTENALCCIVEVFTLGTKSLLPEEERSAWRPIKVEAGWQSSCKETGAMPRNSARPVHLLCEGCAM